jgi:succinate dehydrogenase/fumarate reductase flavoprotein subunit
MNETIITDVLIIGGGGAATRAAVEAAALGVRVDLVDKGACGESGSSPRCLRGFAGMFDKEDSAERFLEDWLRTSGFISDRNLVWEAITQSRMAADELQNAGVEFVTNPDDSRVLYRGAGHTVARGLTAKTPNTAAQLRKEAERRGVTIHEGIMITKLLENQNRVVGAVGVSSNRDFFVFSSKALILAAGGANRLYPNVATQIGDPKYRTTGDGFCLALGAGAPLIDMEFTQFRDSPPGASRFGGKYFNRLGERFMEKYEPQALEKASRNKVVAAIYRELQAGRGPIMWEVGGISEELAKHPPGSLYVNQQWVEVNIDFQRLMGGVRINEKAETAVGRLFAAGESTGGLHGGDRMQGDAFLETQVFGSNAGRNAAALALTAQREDIDPALPAKEQARVATISGDLDPVEITRTVQKTMWEQVGIVRNGALLSDAVSKFEQIRKELIPRLAGDDLFATLEAANLCMTAEIVAKAALFREESRSTQVRTDYPNTDDDNWLKHVCIAGRDRQIMVSTVPVVTLPSG